MSKNRKSLLREAIPHLKLRDISLLESRFERPEIPESEDVELYQQDKRGARFWTGDIRENERDVRLMQIHVSLGSRIVDKPGDDPDSVEPRVFFLIEADYLVEYELTDAVPDEALKAFADLNAVHNVWPFWRQHVFDILSRARLPRMDVPLFAGGAE